MKKIFFFLLLTSCAATTPTPTPAPTVASTNKAYGLTPEIKQKLSKLVPHWKQCVSQYAAAIPGDEYSELNLAFTLNQIGAVSQSNWSYADYPDAVPSDLVGCLDKILKFQNYSIPAGATSHSVMIPVKFFGAKP